MFTPINSLRSIKDGVTIATLTPWKQHHLMIRHIINVLAYNIKDHLIKNRVPGNINDGVMISILTP